MMMGDLVLLDTEVPEVLKKLVSVNLKVTAIHNHLINESPNVKYVHFSGSGDRVKLAEAIKSVLPTTSAKFIIKCSLFLLKFKGAGQAQTKDWLCF